MINQVETNDCFSERDKNKKYKVKNEFTWKQKGGSQLLDNLDDIDSGSVSSDSVRGIF